MDGFSNPYGKRAAERKETEMENQYKEDVEWVIRQVEQDKANEARYPDYKERFPYETVLVDQFQGHCEYGYDTVSRYGRLEDAIASAQKITEQALLISGSVRSWHGMGDAGLVYDLSGKLVWDGVKQYTDCNGSAEVFSAIEFAVKAHCGQYRKGTNIPYIVHPMGVAQILMERGCTNKLVIAGLLHDTLEDTLVTYQSIQASFGWYVAELVKQVSEPNKKDSWKTRKLQTLESLKKAPFDVLLVACADKLDNIRSLNKDFKKEGDKLWKRFNAVKEDIGWYYQSLAQIMKDRIKSGEFTFLAECLWEEIGKLFKREEGEVI